MVRKHLSHLHLSSFSCRTRIASDRGEWGLSVVAGVAPDCRHWCTLASPGPTAAPSHWWASTRCQRSLGNFEAWCASRSLAAQDLGGSHLGSPPRAQLSSQLDRGGAVRCTFHSEGTTAPQCLSLSVENQQFQRPRGETSSHSGAAPSFRPRKENSWSGVLFDLMQPSVWL